MNSPSLKVTYADNQPSSSPLSNNRADREKIQATMERLWHQNPEQFNPHRDCLQRQRIERTKQALLLLGSLEGKRAVDLGCGSGELSRVLRDAGCVVDAVDVASNALERLKTFDTRNIKTFQDCLPSTLLKDDFYDIVLCTEVIGYLNASMHRLLFAELARIVKPDGFVVCSTALDINTLDPLESFTALVKTEFSVNQWMTSSHLLFIKICDFLEAPKRFTKKQQSNYPSKKAWFSFSALIKKGLFPFAWLISFISAPLAKTMRQSNRLLNLLEPICRFFWSESGISHALFIGKRHPLAFPLPENEKPKEMKHKKQVWE